MHATLPLMRSYGFPALRRRRLETLQANLGYKCNQSCVHCHVNAGPTRTEMMSQEILADVLSFLAVSSVKTLDITGGAPELHPRFRDLVRRARDLGAHVIDRCKLTPGQHGRWEDSQRVGGGGAGRIFLGLFSLATVPLPRFGSALTSRGHVNDYRALGDRTHRDESLQPLMSHTMVSVDWQGYVYE